MSTPRFSIVIPYRDRLDNLRLALESLTAQTVEPRTFEIVIGAMEDTTRYLDLCREFADRLTLVSVSSTRRWQVGQARNLAIRQATGDILILMDVDMVLPSRCLEHLEACHFGFGQRVCVIGQMIDYDNNTVDVTEVDAKPYAYYRDLLAELEAGTGTGTGTGTDGRLGDLDPRGSARHVIPWTFAWTALIALPRDLVVAHDLTFDPGFHGYGIEDLEWGYRVCRTGTPIVLGREFFGVHLPHLRDVAANRRTETPNYRYFLSKWPGLDVELACALGDFEANAAYQDYRREIERVAGGPGCSLGVVHSVIHGQSHLSLGVPLPAGSRPEAVASNAPFDQGSLTEVLPIAGVALPYDDAGVHHCLVLPTVTRLPARYRDLVFAEARRVSATPVSLPETGA
ncbi:MAG: glycosyltransferase [Micromonosporaceae bacterium]|nr:glycosyltransferase [Micromonosporaceae bacterium]